MTLKTIFVISAFGLVTSAFCQQPPVLTFQAPLLDPGQRLAAIEAESANLQKEIDQLEQFKQRTQKMFPKTNLAKVNTLLNDLKQHKEMLKIEKSRIERYIPGPLDGLAQQVKDAVDLLALFQRELSKCVALSAAAPEKLPISKELERHARPLTKRVAAASDYLDFEYRKSSKCPDYRSDLEEQIKRDTAQLNEFTYFVKSLCDTESKPGTGRSSLHNAPQDNPKVPGPSTK